MDSMLGAPRCRAGSGAGEGEVRAVWRSPVESGGDAAVSLLFGKPESR